MFLTDANVELILAISAASERLVALVKGRIEWLDKATPTNEDHERNRVWVLRLMAVISGILTAAIASYFIVETPHNGARFWMEAIGVGILAGGGSDFWNSVLGYLNSVKDIKKRG